MPWQCRLIDNPFRPDGPGWDGVQIGDMWFRLDAPTQNGERALPVVLLPSSGGMFAFDLDDAARHGWTVTGEAPAITVAPSIDGIGVYHGFLRNGVISDDLEGRKF